MNSHVVHSLRRRAWLIAAVLVLMLAVTGLGLPAAQVSSAPATADPKTAPVPASGEVAALQATLEGIYSQVNPSVVSIQVVQKETTDTQGWSDQLPFSRATRRTPGSLQPRCRLRLRLGYPGPHSHQQSCR